MGPATCPNCRTLEALVADLQRRVADLEARLATNSSNSSLPPSANPLDAPKPKPKPKSSRAPGAQPGHPPQLKQLLPPERVDHAVVHAPEQCARCQAALPHLPGPHDPPPTRFQIVELPAVVAVVTEHQGQFRTCPCCGHLNHEPIPQHHRGHSVGPRLTAALSYLTGCHGLSKRNVEEIAEALFDAPVSLGTVANLEQEVSAALVSAHEEAVQVVRAAPVKHADETSWKHRGQLCWLWAAATTTMAAFVIHPRRNAAGLSALLGPHPQGIVCSDRWGPYRNVPVRRRQACWAHLKRDFQKIVDRGGPSVTVGRAGQRVVKRVFAAWHRFREGQITRPQLQAELEPVQNRMQQILLEGAIVGTDPKVAAFCENVLALEAALWTFAEVEGVEPTNNHMERLLRRAVLWRKRSFGSWSEAGCRFVERILTVVQTLRLQGKNVLNYLHDVLQAHRSDQTTPKLLQTG